MELQELDMLIIPEQIKHGLLTQELILDHPDLNVNTTLAKTFVLRTVTAEDDNGHGTHCAGIVAAKNNIIGVVGVAANAFVVPVKVLDKTGSGAYSIVIAGIDYVAANAATGDAANLSLSGGIFDPVDQAVINLGLSGVYVAMAAGNSKDDANNYSPARANGLNLYTVSACDINDYWAYFSNLQILQSIFVHLVLVYTLHIWEIPIRQ